MWGDEAEDTKFSVYTTEEVTDVGGMTAPHKFKGRSTDVSRHI